MVVGGEEKKKAAREDMAEEPSVGTRRDSMEVVVKETSESCNPGRWEIGRAHV